MYFSFRCILFVHFDDKYFRTKGVWKKHLILSRLPLRQRLQERITVLMPSLPCPAEDGLDKDFHLDCLLTGQWRPAPQQIDNGLNKIMTQDRRRQPRPIKARTTTLLWPLWTWSNFRKFVILRNFDIWTLLFCELTWYKKKHLFCTNKLQF